MSRVTNRRLRAAAVFATLALAAAACGSSKKATSTTGTTAAGGSGGASNVTVKIGFFGALTGANAQLGINIDNGVKLAVDQHNKKGGAHVDLTPYDSQGDPAQAPQLAQKVISDKVVAVVGPAFSGESKAADPIFEQAGIVNVTPSATNPTLADNGWKYFHRVLANDNAQAPEDAKYIAKKLNAKTVAVIDDNSDYGKGLADGVRTVLKAANVTIPVSESIDPKAQDYSSTVNKVNGAHVDALFYGGYYAEGGRLLKQLRDANVTAKFVSDDGAKDAKLVDTAGASAAAGALVTCPCGDATTSPTGGSFTTDYRAAYNTDPGTYSAEGYDAANVILKAIEAGKTTAKDINDYLASNTFVGITKTIKFDSKGEISGGGIYMYEVKSGKLTLDGLVDQLVGA